MEYKVYIPRIVAQCGIDYLTQRGYEIKMGDKPTEQERILDVADCDAILLRTLVVNRAMIEAGKKLKVIGRHGIGFDNIDVAAATENGIWVTTTPAANGNSVAEHTIGLMLAVSRKMFPLSKAVKEGNFFYKDMYIGHELEGKTFGVVGLGNIGSAAAKKAALGFGMNVIAYKHRVKPETVPDYIRLVEWDELFANSDYVSIHVPKRPETIKLIGKREFEMMKKEAIFINTSRGDVVDEVALYHALVDKEIAGAALDVFNPEPPTPDNPLFQLDNVVVVPHIGSNTYEALDRMSLHAAMEIDRILTGQKPMWPLNSPKTNVTL